MDLNLTRDDYLPGSTEKAKQACLHIATVLGATLDELTVVGGLVPIQVPAVHAGASPLHACSAEGSARR